MIKCLFTFVLVFIFFNAFPDAGFNIRRKTAASVINFSGTANLKAHKLIYGKAVSVDATDKHPYANKGILVDDAFELYIQNGGRHWEESDRNIKLLLVDTLTGVTTDSLQLFAKEYSMLIKIKGENNGKLSYVIDSTKAVYEYSVKEDVHTVAEFNRNRTVFIYASIAGFVLLTALFFIKKKKANV